jgi:hypothetical protein
VVRRVAAEPIVGRMDPDDHAELTPDHKQPPMIPTPTGDDDSEQ